jgi:nicotinamidase-related amidase
MRSVLRAAAVAVALAGFGLMTAQAADVVNEWASVKTPAPPELKPVTADPKTTALLMLDFMNQNCGRRPRCVESVPAVKALLTEARAKGAPVIYSIINNTTTADVIKDVAPNANEPFVQAGPNKFIRTDLEKILKDKGVQTVIVVGTAAHGAVLNTGSYAALLGMNVIVPVDGMSADAYAEQYTAWHMANAPSVGPKTTLTRLNQIKF